jgi:hypothetical protein
MIVAASKFLAIATFAILFAVPALPQSQSTQQNSSIVVDAVAVRIESDVITESELRELADFQLLVDGKSNPRSELINELVDQWIVKNEAQSSQFLRPQPDEIDKALADLTKHFKSSEVFHQRMTEVDLTEKQVRRQLALQIYLDRFLDYKFRAAAQVDDQQIKDYYSGEFTAQAQAHNEKIPPLEDVQADIHEVLTERLISEKATKWLNDTRARLHIEILNADDSAGNASSSPQ